MKKKSIFFYSLLLMIFTFNGASFASYYNNYQHLIGERASGMGGAYTALANDSTALWYNPAGLANLSSKNVNISANTYNYLHTKTKGYLEFEKSDGTYEKVDVNESNFSAVANTISFASTIGENNAIAFGIFIPIQDETKGILESKYKPSANTTIKHAAEYNLESEYYIGMFGWGAKPVRNLGVGLAAGLGYYQFDSSGSRITYAFYDGGPNQEQLYVKDVSVKTNQLTIQAGAGIQYQFNNNKIGLMVQSPAWRIKGRTDIKMFIGSANTGGYEYNEKMITEKKDDELYRKVLPWFCSLGYAYASPGAFALSFEVVPVFKTAERPNNVINYKAGFEINLSGSFILRGGFFTDFSQKDDIDALLISDYDPVSENLDFYGATMSVSFAHKFGDKEQKAASQSWTTLGVIFRYGTGKVISQRFDLKAPYGYGEPQYIKKDKSIINFGVTIAESVSF